MDEVIEPELMEGEQELMENVNDEEPEQEQAFVENNEAFVDPYEHYPEDTWEENEEGMDELSPFLLF